MSTPEYDPLSAIDRPEPTLGTALRSLATRQHSTQFYYVLELGLPAAVQLGAWGMWRTAGWASVVASFGAWALFEKRIRADAKAVGLPPDQLHPRRWLTTGRTAAGLVGALLAFGLTLELFARAVSPFMQGCCR